MTILLGFETVFDGYSIGYINTGVIAWIQKLFNERMFFEIITNESFLLGHIHAFQYKIFDFTRYFLFYFTP